MFVSKGEDKKTEQYTIRMTKKDYTEFNKMCHYNLKNKSEVTLALVLDWMEKERKK